MQKVVIPPVVALNEMLTGWLNGLNGTKCYITRSYFRCDDGN